MLQQQEQEQEQCRCSSRSRSRSSAAGAGAGAACSLPCSSMLQQQADEPSSRAINCQSLARAAGPPRHTQTPSLGF